MKGLIGFCLLFFVISLAFAEPSVSRIIPASVEVNEVFDVILIINPGSETKLDIAEFIPSNWEIVEWTAYPKSNVEYISQTHEFLGMQRNMNHWKFNSIENEIIIEYQVTAKDTGDKEFIVLWVFPEGFETNSESITVTEKLSENFESPLTGYAIMDVEQEESSKTFNVDIAKNTLFNAKNLVFNVAY